MTSFVLATANAHKALEIRAVLAELGVEVADRPANIPEVDETASTLEGNALLKAQTICRWVGGPAIADDTGLFVDVLGGAPGVHSARYAGADASDVDNVNKLLSELLAVPPSQRRARFRTVIAVAYPDGTSLTVDGTIEGSILEEPRGDQGFGYDPVFAADDLNGRTLAEASATEKNSVSHRSRALRALAATLAR